MVGHVMVATFNVRKDAGSWKDRMIGTSSSHWDFGSWDTCHT